MIVKNHTRPNRPKVLHARAMPGVKFSSKVIKLFGIRQTVVENLTFKWQ
jgi:hypothetical protein